MARRRDLRQRLDPEPRRGRLGAVPRRSLAWVDPWGWTWVDDAPWGFAVSHYGRWANLHGAWGWVPGPVRGRAYYAPALVVFVGGDNFGLAVPGGIPGGIGWFALGPREVYRPSYQVSRGYFDSVNSSNTVVNTTVINNYYNNTNVTNVTYVNRQVPGAVIAVPTTTFVQSQPVSRAAIRVTREMVASAPVVGAAPVAPTEQSVRGSAAARGKPPARAFDRPVVARTAPPAAPVSFAAQREHLNANRGKPLDDAARSQMKPLATVPTPVVNVVAHANAAPPTAIPPASGAGRNDSRATRDEAHAAPATPARPAAAAPRATQDAPALSASKPAPAPRVAEPKPAPQKAAQVVPSESPAKTPAARSRLEPAPVAVRDVSPQPVVARPPSPNAVPSEREPKPAHPETKPGKSGRDDKNDKTDEDDKHKK